MRTSLVITFVGQDRPGIVEALARVVLEHRGNWERSRMAKLSGRFAGILEVTVPGEHAPALSGALQAVAGLQVFVDQRPGREPPPGSRALRLELVGQDREGIVREISSALAQRRVNIEDLSSESQSAPMSGERLFRVHAQLRAPNELDLGELRQVLERLSAELLVDLALAEAGEG